MVVKNPVACMMFFHTMISSFISVILRYGRHEWGLFGHCNSYFGTVEAQGKGTLHCHMLIWLEEHPTPQKMHDYLTSSSQYQEMMFMWLESIIKSKLLGTAEVVTEPGGIPLLQPRYEEEGKRHPATLLLPMVADIPCESFWREFEYVINELVKAFNWHEHTDTCWKYLCTLDPRDDTHCCMQIDGSTQLCTCIDEETGLILLRRLHLRITNYNNVVIFLMQCNMDVKHVGSGEGVNRLVHYVMEYATKSSLPAHVGLAALLYAIQRTNMNFPGGIQEVEDSPRSALMMTVNCMLSCQELSHQQVMSYLVGSGDHYKSHRYCILYFSAFEHFFRQVWDDLDRPGMDASSTYLDVDVPEDFSGLENTNCTAVGRMEQLLLHSSDSITGELFYKEDVTLYMSMGTISAVNQQQDYIYHSEDEEFDHMCLYEFIRMVEKVTKRSEEN